MSETVRYTVGEKVLEFDVVSTEDIKCKDVEDERGNQVMMQVTMRFRMVLNPATLGSYRIQGVNIVTGFGNLPATTSDAISWHMNTPRGRLVWTIGDVVQISSPEAGLDTDAANGPLPNVVSIAEIHGLRTWEMIWEVTTFLHYADRFTGEGSTPRRLLSHTWTTTETLSRSLGYRSIRVTEGTAIFDTSTLDQISAGFFNPDSFRLHLMPVCPGGFAREDIEVVADPSGAILRYRVTDHEQYITMTAHSIVYADCAHSFDTIAPTIGGVVGNTLNLATTLQNNRDAGQAAERRALEKNIKARDGRTYKPEGVYGRQLANASALTHTFFNSLPLVNWNVVTHVKGTKRASVEYLILKATKVLNYRLRLLNENHYQVMYHGQYHPEENVVQLSAAYRRNLEPGRNLEFFTDTLGDSGDDLAPDVATRVPHTHPITQLRTKPQDLGSNIPPSDSGCRGYALAHVIAQQLSDFGERPAPPVLRRAGGTTPADPHR